MPSRELKRLSQLKIDTMPEARLRTEVTESITRLKAEFSKLETEHKESSSKLRASTMALSNLKTQYDDLDSRYQRETNELAQLKSENARLLESLKLTESFTQDEMKNFSPKLLEKIQVLEFDRSSAQARLRATESLLEKLQKEQQQTRTTQQIIPTTELLNNFAKDIATAELPSGFEIDDVEVEVRGALGTRENQVVIGLDATKLAGTESVTSLRFALRRTATVKKIE